MNPTVLDIAIIVGIIMGYFMSISLITTPFFKNRANNYLSLSLFLLTTLTFIDWYGTENIIFQFLDNFRLDILIGVTFFTYFLVQINHKHLNKSWYKWLYVPFICSIILEIVIFLFHFVFDLYSPLLDDVIYNVKDIVAFGSNILFIIWGRNLIKGATNISEDKKRWLLRFNFFLISIIIIWCLSYLESLLFDSEYSLSFQWMLVSFLSWWILYYGVFKLQIVVQKDEIHQYLLSKNNNETPVKKKINEATTSKIMDKLYALMKEEQLYKNPLLSRLDIATKLDTSEGYLSQIINQEIKKSVIQFVNEYRIEEAKSLLHNPVFNKYSIEAIGLEAGFKSKSAFYKTFNTSMGMSPGAFRKLQKLS